MSSRKFVVSGILTEKKTVECGGGLLSDAL